MPAIANIPSATDFVISHLRDSFGLYFEVNEGWPTDNYEPIAKPVVAQRSCERRSGKKGEAGESAEIRRRSPTPPDRCAADRRQTRFWDRLYINEAFLTDGRSSLMVWAALPPTFATAHILADFNGQQVAFQGSSTFDSRLKISDSEFIACVQEAVTRYKNTPQNDIAKRSQTISLFSIEIGGRQPLSNVMPYLERISAECNATIQRLPLYDGTERDNMDRVPVHSCNDWIQFTCQTPVTEETANRAWSCLLQESSDIQAGDNHRFRSNETAMQSTGIEYIRLLTRRY